MSTYQSLRRQLEQTPFLLIDLDADQCRLIGHADAARLVIAADGYATKNGRPPAMALLPISRGLPDFVARIGEGEREFTLREIAAVAGVGYGTADDWFRAGVIKSTIETPAYKEQKRFGWIDVWSAAVIGSLRRLGVPLPMLRRVSDLFQQAKPTPTPTAERAVSRA